MSRADELVEFRDEAQVVAFSRKPIEQSGAKLARSWLIIGDPREQNNVVELATIVRLRSQC